MTQPRSLAWVLVMACVLLVSNAFAAGRVLFVKGSAQLERDSKVQLLVKGTTVEAGDVVVTGIDGRVQLLMDDGDRMALQPNTRLRIDEFAEPQSSAQPETGRAFYSLLRGGFRALTRSLGTRSEPSYQVRTPVATIGIRGTDYSLDFEEGGPTPDDDELNGHVSKGGVWVKDEDGQYYYVYEGESFTFDTQGFQKSQRQQGPSAGDFDTGDPNLDGPPQPIQGTDPSGNPFDLTPGQGPPEPHQPSQGPVNEF